jgi:hypothetical protein
MIMNVRVLSVLAAVFALIPALAPGADDTRAEEVRIKLLGANPSAVSMPIADFPVPSFFFSSGGEGAKGIDVSKLKRGWFRDVYPGIDLVCYSDDYHVEYIFVVSPGSDVSLIRWATEGTKRITLDHDGNILLETKSSEVNQSRPVVFLQREASKIRIDGTYSLDKDDVITVTPGKEFLQQVLNDQFMEFLNSAQTNNANLLGGNMHFDKDGNIWVNSLMPENGKMFDISASRLLYEPGQPVGSRYYHQRAEAGKTPFVNRPVAGVSWLGAMKYCNWLTLHAEREAQKRCYAEGTDVVDWTPIPGTNWARGYFQAAGADESKGFQAETPYPPTATFLIHILFSFYMEPAATRETTEVTAGKEEETPAAEESKKSQAGGGLAVDVTVPSRVSDEVTPDGFVYKTKTSPEVEATVQPVERGGGGEAAKPSLPPSVPEGPRSYTLTVYSSNPNNSVFIDATPDISTNAGDWVSFVRTYIAGSGVTLTAPLFSPIATVFHQWQSSDGRHNSTNLSVSFVMQADLAMTAVYVVPPRLTVTSMSPPSGVTIVVSVPDMYTGFTDGNTTFFRDYFPNTTVTLIAPAGAPGSTFSRWMKDGVDYSFSATTTVTIAVNTTMTAVFSPRTLYVRSSGPGSGVSITVSPNDIYGNGSADTPFDLRYYDGATVTLTGVQTAPNGNVFEKWQRDGIDYSTNRTTSVTMDIDYTMLAVYVYVPPPIPNPDVSPAGI